MNMTVKGGVSADQDPLGLGRLEAPVPEKGSEQADWDVVSAALDADRSHRRRTWIGSLATAASILLVIAMLNLPITERNAEPDAQQVASQTDAPALLEDQQPNEPNATQPTTDELIGMSQTMERQLRQIRSRVGAMPSQMIVYQVELQDLIIQVDDALSLAPDSRELWSQRVELQMDLMKLYRNQLRRDYHRIASV